MEKQETCKQFRIKDLSKKAKVGITVLCMMVLIGSVLAICFFKYAPGMEWPDVNESMQIQEISEYLTADGSTTMGTIPQEVDFDVTITPLYVEEVYVATGDNVEEGTALLKIA